MKAKTRKLMSTLRKHRDFFGHEKGKSYDPGRKRVAEAHKFHRSRMGAKANIASLHKNFAKSTFKYHDS